MKKKFYKYSTWLVMGCAVASALISLLYFLMAESLEEGSGILVFMFYVKTILDLASSFIGLGTIIYAITKFSWYDGLKMCGIYGCSILIFFVFQTITSTIYTGDLSNISDMYADEIVRLVQNNAYYALGQLAITAMIPVLIVMIIANKHIKKDETPFLKFVSFKNPVQKTMAWTCITIFAANTLSFLLLNVLPYLIQEEFYITFNDFKSIILQSVLTLAENALLHLIVQYIVFMLTFRFYDACLNGGKDTVVNNKNK